MKTVADQQVIKITSTSDMRKYLLEQMQGVVDGKVSLETAKGVSNLAQQVYNTINIEVKVANAREQLGDAAIRSVSFNE